MIKYHTEDDHIKEGEESHKKGNEVEGKLANTGKKLSPFTDSIQENNTG